MAPTTKSRATKSTKSISARPALVVKSGKYTLGYKSALKQMRSGKGEPLFRIHHRCTSSLISITLPCTSTVQRRRSKPQRADYVACHYPADYVAGGNPPKPDSCRLVPKFNLERQYSISMRNWPGSHLSSNPENICWATSQPLSRCALVRVSYYFRFIIAVQAH